MEIGFDALSKGAKFIFSQKDRIEFVKVGTGLCKPTKVDQDLTVLIAGQRVFIEVGKSHA
tara:strand:- start:14796 stop:14975 length:180 start_codon:yes stop_codon:yes gene_type:complete